MKKIVVIADNGWAIKRIHIDLEHVLRDEYSFKYYDSAGFSWESFMADFKDADICLSTLNHFHDLLNTFPNDSDRRKLVYVHHGASNGANYFRDRTDHPYTLGAVNRINQELMAEGTTEPVYLVKTGTNPSVWNYRAHTGAVTRLGWCGAPSVAYKNFDWAQWISADTNVPLAVASQLSQPELRGWYNTIDVLLVTAGPLEAGPLPPFEAICSGVLVVGTPVGNSAELPGPKFNTKEEAVAIIQRLKEDPEEVRRLAKEQYDCVMAKWTYETLKNAWCTMFEAAIAKCEQKPVANIE